MTSQALPISTTETSSATSSTTTTPTLTTLRTFLTRLFSSLRTTLSNRRPWLELVDRTAFSRPLSLSDATTRVRKNFSYFKINYLTILAIVLAFSLLSHPFSLLTLLSLVAAWLGLYTFRPSDQPLVVLGRTMSNREVLGILVLVTVIVVFLTSVGSLIITAVLVGVGIVLVCFIGFYYRSFMGSRYPSHRLGNGLVVSGRLEQPKEKAPTMSSSAMPYTGGDIKKSGELGKMFIPTEGSKSRKSGPITGPPSRTGSFAGAASHSGSMMSNAASRAGYTTSGPLSSGGLPGSASLKKSSSGPLNKHGEPIKKSSGPQSCGVTRQNSGSIPSALPATGLITSGPISSGPLNSSGAPRKVSGPLESTGSMKLNSSSISNNPAVTTLSQDDDYSVRRNFPKTVVWLVILIFVMGLLAGGFILGAVHNAILLVVVVVLFVIVAALVVWNMCGGRRYIVEFTARYPDADLRTAKNGQYVKVSGVVTCGNVPLESSFQRVPRCVYTSTRLYEYRAWGSKPANPSHRHFTWGLRSSERHVVDFYISDFQSGLRALVKTGNGTRITPFVDDSLVVDINPEKKDLSPEFVRWLGKKNLSGDERLMRLKEGYIKEGSTVSVMGTVQRNDNVLMIVAPPEPLATGWQWSRCIFPASLDGIVLRCEDTSNDDVIPV